METFAFDTSMLAGPFVLACALFMGCVWLAMVVASLKLSLSLTTNQDPSYLHCSVMLILIMMGNAAVFFGIFLTLGPQPWYITMCYQAFVQIGLMMIVVRCNPYSAFFASICHSFFSSVGTVVIVLAFVLVCGSALRGAADREKRANAYKTIQERQDAARSWFRGFDPNYENPWLKKRSIRKIRYTDNPFTH